MPAERKFAGFDAYEKLLATDVDVVLQATSPHFRPLHLKAAVAAGKHVFCEKPVAVDAPGVHSVLATAEEAKKKNLALVSGLCYRYDLPKRALIESVRDGAIGDIRTIQPAYNAGTPEASWPRAQLEPDGIPDAQLVLLHLAVGRFQRRAARPQPGQSPLGLGRPESDPGLWPGGRQVRTGDEYGNIYDHMAVVYEFPDGVRVFSNCRQMAGCSVDVSDTLFGTKGTAEMQKAVIQGENPWTYRGDKPNMYDVEHQEMFAAIRSGKPINNGQYMADSTMMGIMGRMVCYTGQTLTWEQCLASKEDLTPAQYAWGPAPTVTVAMPGLTAFA